MQKLRIAVLGTVGADPFAGMAWMHLQLAAGLLRLGHEVRYVETTSAWPYDVDLGGPVNDATYTLAYLARVTVRFGMGQHWAWRRSFGDGAWFGPAAPGIEAWLADCDLVLNVTGSTCLLEDGFATRAKLVYVGTDPVGDELRHAAGEAYKVAHLAAHDAVLTYGENIGTPRSPLPPLPGLVGHMRQPVLMDMWAPQPGDPIMRDRFTTVGNWRQNGNDDVFQGRPLRWSKHHEFLKFIDVPRLAGIPVELATNLRDNERNSAQVAAADEPGKARGAVGMDHEHIQLLKDGGWVLADGPALSTDPFTYRRYLMASKAEFSVAREFNVLPRSGWFSERSACYLAAGRPVVTQDTGFTDVLPCGEGLIGFSTLEEAVEGLRAVQADYPRHARAALAIAREHFAAEVVLPRMLADLGA